MLREVKRAALRKCWLHIHFPLELVQREGPHLRGRLTLRLFAATYDPNGVLPIILGGETGQSLFFVRLVVRN